MHVEGPVGLGHRRLAVIDLETGDQPIYNEDRSIVLIVNGEIYDFRALRADLERRGHRFATRTDSEVIVHLYEEKGVDCLEDLRGMFAFAIWDVARRRLFAAIDRVASRVSLVPVPFGCEPHEISDASGAAILLCGAAEQNRTVQILSRRRQLFDGGAPQLDDPVPLRIGQAIRPAISGI